jgi:hypothetical protein
VRAFGVKSRRLKDFRFQIADSRFQIADSDSDSKKSQTIQIAVSY